MKETTKYEIIAHWIDTCETDHQLNNLREAIEKRFKLDEMTKDDLIAYWVGNKVRRQWVSAKVAQRDYTPVDRFPACDEYNEDSPTDIA